MLVYVHAHKESSKVFIVSIKISVMKYIKRRFNPARMETKMLLTYLELITD